MAPCVDSFGPESRMNEGFRAETPAAGARVWQVGALVRAIADTLQARFNPAAVRGEISGFSRAASGHCYFSLKDAQGQIRCAMFRRAAQGVDFNPAEGDRLTLYGVAIGARNTLHCVVIKNGTAQTQFTATVTQPVFTPRSCNWVCEIRVGSDASN